MFTRYITHLLHKLPALGLLLFFISSSSIAKPVKVLVSIKPLHSLISHITDGVSQPKLLLDQQQSPHHFQLRPSQKRMINNADIFFYSSDNIEGFVPALKETTKRLQFIQLSKLTEINSLPVRSFHSHHNHISSDRDGHIWLSIENAKLISQYVADILSKHSPEYALRYKENLNTLLTRLEKLKRENMKLLGKHSNTPYLVYHDAYQYFELENNLTGAHFITTNPEHSPGIKRIKELRKLIESENIQCIFYEPPNIPPLLNTLTENKSIKLSAIDPSGSQIPMGKPHYFQLLQQTAVILDNCLK